MTTPQVVTLLQQALLTTALVGGPILVVTLVVGLVISVVQAATQINEATMTFLPKLVVVAAILWVAGPWMLAQLVGFTTLLIQALPEAAR